MPSNQDLSLFFKRIIASTKTTKQAPNEARYFELTVGEQRIVGVSFDGYAIAKAEVVLVEASNSKRATPFQAVYDAETLPLLRDIFNNRLECIFWTNPDGSGEISFKILNSLEIKLHPARFIYPDWRTMVKKYRLHQHFVGDRDEIREEVRSAKRDGAGIIEIGDALVTTEILENSVPLCNDGKVNLNPVIVHAAPAKQEPEPKVGLAVISDNFTYLAAPCFKKDANTKVHKLRAIKKE